eukprot:gene26939-4560_t
MPFSELPGFTRSVYSTDHALVTSESRVKGASTAHIISKASGANFAMYLADCKAGGYALPAQAGVERIVIVLNGEVQLETSDGKDVTLSPNHYAYFPANDTSK